jgi:hypothetical protein
MAILGGINRKIVENKNGRPSCLLLNQKQKRKIYYKSKLIFFKTCILLHKKSDKTNLVLNQLLDSIFGFLGKKSELAPKLRVLAGSAFLIYRNDVDLARNFCAGNRVCNYVLLV